MKRINILIGNYGSGKTEIALNMAKKLAKSDKDVLFIDYDIINPYFRSSKHTKMMEDMGIEVVKPMYANANVDLPTLPPQVYNVLSTKKHVVIDCGGDPAGAKALGFLAKELKPLMDEIDVFFVVNPLRPLQKDEVSILELKDALEHTSRLKATKLIYNANLAYETTAETLENSLALIQSVSRKTELDIAYICGTQRVVDGFFLKHPELSDKRYEIEIFMRLSWMNPHETPTRI